MNDLDAKHALWDYTGATPKRTLSDDILNKWVGELLRKPMTLTEANLHLSRVWVEFRHFKEANGWRNDLLDALYWVDRVYDKVRAPEFGVHYRLWAFRPTEEERKAAPWEV